MRVTRGPLRTDWIKADTLRVGVVPRKSRSPGARAGPSKGGKPVAACAWLFLVCGQQASKP
eukprot:849587-Lingulodinium_polyedra.AAC.1